jgi:hypothetical protein
MLRQEKSGNPGSANETDNHQTTVESGAKIVATGKGGLERKKGNCFSHILSAKQ